MGERIKIVLSLDANSQEKFAAEELVYFLKEVSGAEGIIVTEDNFNSCSSELYFSVGLTESFKNVIGFNGLFDSVGEDGYRIVSKNSCIYICGGAGQGTIFGVYRYLKETFNLIIYTETVYTYDYKPLRFDPIDILEKPDLPMRALGIFPVHLEKRDPMLGNKRYCYRMRLRQMDEGWGINNHSYFRILPPNVYNEAHPDWYNKNVTQLCLTNKSAIKEYVKNMKKVIENTPNDSLYMFGMEDTMEFCDCPKCMKIINKYGYAWLSLSFANKLAKELNKWLKKVHPERKVYFFTFAYNKAILPPVKKIAEGKYELLVKNVKLEDNLGVLIAPIHTSANYPLTDTRSYYALSTRYNGKERISNIDLFGGWRAIVKYLAVWTYNRNFYDYMTPCPMWVGFKENFKWFKELNAIHVFMEAGCTMRSNFSEMKIFVCSNLMWDTSLEQDQLVRQFMKVYFEGADEQIYEYFSYIHEHAEWMRKIYGREQIYVHFDDDPNKRLLDVRFWPKEMFFKCLDIFNNALSKDIKPEVVNRINIETIPVKFSLLRLYLKELDKNFALSLIDDMVAIANKNDMSYATDEKPETIQAFAEKWKKELLCV